MFGLSRSTVTTLISRGQLASVKIGRAQRVLRRDLDACLAALTAGGRRVSKAVGGRSSVHRRRDGAGWGAEQKAFAVRRDRSTKAPVGNETHPILDIARSALLGAGPFAARSTCTIDRQRERYGCGYDRNVGHVQQH